MPATQPMNLFERLLAVFPEAVMETHELIFRSDDGPDIQMAIVGFHHFCDEPNQDIRSFIRAHSGELSDAALAQYGNAAVAIRSFSCFALGGLLGLSRSGQIDDSRLALLQAQLPQFIDDHLPAIQKSTTA